MTTPVKKSLWLSIIILLIWNYLPAQEAEELSKAAEVAKKLANPNASIGFFAIPVDYISYNGTLSGASDQNAFKMSFQPSLPYVIKPGQNFFFRPLIPFIISQSSINENGEFEKQSVELGDIGFDVAYGITFPSKTIGIIGVAGSAPTATSAELGTGRWMLGPEIFVGQGADWGMLGILLTHSWSLNKNNSESHDQNITPDDFMFINDNYYPDNEPGGDNTLSITAGQYFYTINLKNAWQIQSQPTFTINHKAEKGSKWSFPLGTGVAKTIIAGNMPLKLSLQYWYYVVSPEAYGPQHQIRFQIAPVIPLPW